MQYDFYQTSLSKCLSLIIDYRGRTPKKLGLDWSDDGYRAISANNVKFSGLTKIDDIKFGNQELYDLWMKKEVKKGDLLLTSEAPSGQVMIWDSDEKIILSQRLYALRVNDNFDNKYLKYYIQSEMGQKEIIKNNSGSTVFGISAKTFDNIIVYHPIKDIQEKIGNLLYTIDKKIALNKQINARLEEMAKTLYDYWFVQFDFPDANGKPYKSSGGEMVFDETLKREIPKGWEVKSLGDWAEIRKGTLITEKTANTNGDIKVISAGVDFSYYHDVANRPKNTITISASGANAGFVNFWREPIFACDCTTITNSVIGRTLYILNFLKIVQDFIYQQARGSAQPHVYPKDIEGLKIIVPPDLLLKRFSEFVENWNLKIANNEKQNHHLTQLRDFLLPMLMNGQVSVE